MFKQKHTYFFLFVAFLFLGICSFELFSEGMFVDGLMYASISRNLSIGVGEFWTPHFSNGLLKEFYANPPMALWLQSLGFSIFGDSIYVERIYSLLTYVITGYILVLIWSRVTDEIKWGWLPLFLWIITGSVAWAASNNLLENTMSIFICLAMLFYLNSLRKNRWIWLTSAGFMLSLAFLTKGVLGLFIWSVPLIYWFLMRKKKISATIYDTFVLVICTLLPIALLVYLFPAARNNLTNYFNFQLVDSIQNIRTVDNRVAILVMFLKNIIIPLVVAGLILLVGWRKNIKLRIIRTYGNQSLLFFLLVLSGILPIMISMKQSQVYILSTYPFFAIGIALLLFPVMRNLVEKINSNSAGFRYFKIFTFGIVVLSIVSTILQTNRPGRDSLYIRESKAIIAQIGENKTLNICPELYLQWKLHGYFQRYGRISLDRNEENVFQNYLSSKQCNNDLLLKDYSVVPSKTDELILLKRIE